MNPTPNIVIAGASGYVGQALIPRLRAAFPQSKITALSRSAPTSNDPMVEGRACDLFSIKSLEEALPERVDLAFYLVHSMGPTAQLDQGCFSDYDLILADNFARALRGSGLKHLVYLGGLVPETEKLSRHLESRLEVETVFKEHDIPTTVLRAGMILGNEGSSFQILVKLVSRLPILICPGWTKTKTTPVDLESVVQSLCSVALQKPHIGRIYDLAGCRPITYLEMMKETSRRLGKKRFFLSIPHFAPALSGLWVSLITGAPRALVFPLVESLKSTMLARPDHTLSDDWLSLTYADLLGRFTPRPSTGSPTFRFRAQRNTVRSVQRLTLPKGKSAAWVKDRYLAWLPRFLSPLGKVTTTDGHVEFRLFGLRLLLLELVFSTERSSPDRQLLYIKGGILVAEHNRGRLEFREVLNRKHILCAIHDYRPSLPWYIYVCTQAQVHLLVMRAFERHLRKSAKRTWSPQPQ